MDFEELKRQHGEDAVKEAFMLGVIQGLKQAQEWRPIETAPKDLTAILGYFAVTDTHHWIDVCYFNELHGWMTLRRYGDDEEQIKPTHWIPLPSPPKEQ